MNKKRLEIFYKYLLPALVLSAISFLLADKLIEDHLAEIETSGSYLRPRKRYYVDLNNDGQKEKVVVDNYRSLGRPMVKVSNNKNNEYIGIWNLEGEYIKNTPLLFADCNKDGRKEIYAFCRKKDSIFINGIDYSYENNYILENFFITRTQFFQKKIDLEIRPVGEEDLNDDGFNELYFAVDAGFSMKPRAIYAVDIHNKKIHKSPESGVRFTKSSIIMYDIDNDGDKEIIPPTHASKNYPAENNVPYDDRSAWLMVLDKKLNFLFEPIEYKGAPSLLYVKPYYTGKEIYISALFSNKEKNNRQILLALYSTKGKLLKEKDLKEYPGIEEPLRINHYKNPETFEQLYYHTQNGKIYFFNESLDIEKTKNLEADQTKLSYYVEIDESKPNKEIFIPAKDGYMIYDNEYKKSVSIPSPKETLSFYNVTVYDDNQNKIIYAENKDKWLKISYSENLSYTYRWIIPPVIFIIVILTIYIWKRHLRKRYERKIQQKLQMQEAEKKRLAKELHDELGNKLTGLRLQIEEAKENGNLGALDQLTNKYRFWRQPNMYFMFRQEPDTVN